MIMIVFKDKGQHVTQISAIVFFSLISHFVVVSLHPGVPVGAVELLDPRQTFLNEEIIMEYWLLTCMSCKLRLL